MEWFYRLDGQENGPIGASDLRALFKAGAISAETEVRRGDMAAWRPLRHFVKSGPPAHSATAAAPPAQTREEPPAPQPGRPAAATCTECGRARAADDLIRLDDAHICADCKPLFIQKLRQGGHVQVGPVYAGFWIRFGAKFIDALILVVVNTAVGLVYALSTGGWAASDASTAGQLPLQAIYHAIGMAYTTFFLGRFGATPGKMACGLKVVVAGGRPISYRRALGRQLAEYLSGMLLMLGYLMAAFDSEKRALHDRICKTRVVRT